MPWLAAGGAAAGGTAAGAGAGAAAGGAAAAGAGAVGASGLGIGGATAAGGLGTAGGLGVGGAASGSTLAAGLGGAGGTSLGGLFGTGAGTGAAGGYGAGAGLAGSNVLSGAVGAGGIGGGSSSLALGMFPNLSAGLAGAGWNLPAFAEGASILGAAKGAGDYAGAGAKKAASKIPTAKTVTGNGMVDGLMGNSFGHKAAAAGSKPVLDTSQWMATPANLLKEEGGGIGASSYVPTTEAQQMGKIPGGGSTPDIRLLSPQANADLAKFVAKPGETAMRMGKDYLTGNPFDMERGSFSRDVGSTVLDSLFKNDQAPAGQVNPNAGQIQQQQPQSAEDQMNALLANLFAGRMQ